MGKNVKVTLKRTIGLRRRGEISGRLYGPGEVEMPEEDARSLGLLEDAEPRELEDRSKDELEEEAKRRELEVKGTGADGNVLKEDLVKALRKAEK